MGRAIETVSGYRLLHGHALAIGPVAASEMGAKLGYCDVVFILDNRYADIYVKGSERARFAEAGSIKKLGEWIIVNRYANGYDEEIRIKESDIVRIDYYGRQMLMVEKRKLFQKRQK